MSLGISREELARILAFELRRPEMSGEPFSVTTMAENILAAYEVEPSPDVWEAIEPPQDGTVFYAVVRIPMKWTRYKPTSQQAKYGVKGRWQESNGFGGWNNSTFKPEQWERLPDPPKVTVEEDRA